MDIHKIENELRELLPSKFKESSVDIEKIISLTEELIELSKSIPSDHYSHNVCHLFEAYGKKNYDKSYLNSTELAEITEKLVNVTLEGALKSEKFGCIDRILAPIAQYNIDNMDENGGKFVFKPAVLSNPEFIKFYGEQVEKYKMEGKKYIEHFCKADSFDAYVESMKQSASVAQTAIDDTTILPGVFSDVDNTLLRFGMKLIKETHNYLVKKLEEGTPVTVFTGGDPKAASEKLKELGADTRLLDVKPKTDYLGKMLEICIDDTTPAIQGFRAKTHYDPNIVDMTELK